jgi:polysaccharide biosynthesis/export protein
MHILHFTPFRVVLAGLVLVSSVGKTIAADAGIVPPAQVVSATVDYQLRPSDILQIKVFQEEDLTREISISQEYTISLPLIGTVDVRNRSVRQVEENIRQLYDRDYLVNPQISLIVLKYAERAVNVMGAVNSPQAVPFPPEGKLTLLDALSRAGGFNRLADKQNVRITRTDDKGVSTTFTINAEKLMDSKGDNLWYLQVNDVIFVKENFL